MKAKSESEVAQSCPTLSDPMDCSPPGSSVHGIFQARVLEWGAIAFSLEALWEGPIPGLLPWQLSFLDLQPNHSSLSSSIFIVFSPLVRIISVCLFLTRLYVIRYRN